MSAYLAILLIGKLLLQRIAVSPRIIESKNEKSTKESKASAKKPKLSYHLQRELDELPELIHQLEEKITKLESIVSADSFYKQAYEKNQQTLKQLSNTQKELDKAMDRWVEIENQTQAE